MNKEIKDLRIMVEDAMMIIAGDHYNDIYEKEGTWVGTNNTIRCWAEQFVDELNWQFGDDDRDWIIELEKFEEKMIKTL